MIINFNNTQLSFLPSPISSLPLDFIENGYSTIEVNFLRTFEKLRKDSDEFSCLVRDFYDPNADKMGSIKRVERLKKQILSGEIESPVLIRSTVGTLRILDGRHRIFALKELLELEVISGEAISVSVSSTQEELFADIQ